jgi:hypothetical protein
MGRTRPQRARANGLPCHHGQRRQQYTGQVVGDWRANETSIKVLPREDGDVNIAEVRSELIRSIELQSKADRIYASSLGQMVACGISNFRVDRGLCLRGCVRATSSSATFRTRWRCGGIRSRSIRPGRDATYCFVGDEITTEEYKRRYPKAALPSLIQRNADRHGATARRPAPRILEDRPSAAHLRHDGRRQDGRPHRHRPQASGRKLAIDIDTKQPIIREKAKCKYAVMVMTNGMER